jgi:predicted HicB family RNase H-like nuclease
MTYLDVLVITQQCANGLIMKTIKEKRRKRAIPGRSAESRKLMVYLYDDEHELIREAAITNGTSMSAYLVMAAIEKARREIPARK